jgi:hypothetical protein
VPPLLALALVRLGAGRRFSSIAVLSATAVTTAAAALLRSGVHPTGLANRWNVASLPAPTFQLGPKVLLVAGFVAIAAVVAVTVVRRRNVAAIAPLVMLLFLPTTAVAERNPVLKAESAFYPSGWASPATAADGARAIAFDTDGGGSVFVYQWFASKAKLVLFSGASERPPARYVFSSPDWAAAHRSLHPTQLWDDPGRGGRLFHVR